MHKNLSVIDGVYGILSDLDVRKQIVALGNQVENKEELIELLKKLVKQYENPPK